MSAYTSFDKYLFYQTKYFLILTPNDNIVRCEIQFESVESPVAKVILSYADTPGSISVQMYVKLCSWVGWDA